MSDTATTTIEIHGTKETSVEEETMEAAITRAKAMAKDGYAIHDIGSRTVVGICENCEEFIFTTTKFYIDGEGTVWHKHDEDCKIGG